MKTVILPSGERVPAYGQGTWHMGDDRKARAEEIATLRSGLDLGLTLIDTAEMYGDGRAEQLVAEAISGRRKEVFLVSKVLPHHATQRGTVSACERSLKHLKTDRIDLYLLHWRGNVPLADTLQALMALQSGGKIRHYGVSNFDLADIQELWTLDGSAAIATNQLLYNLTRRGIEWDLLPWLRAQHVPIMAYSPLEEGRLIADAQLVGFAQRHAMTPPQAALAWLLSKDDVIAIPKCSHRQRLKENFGALERRLTQPQLAELDRLFRPPKGPRPLEML